MNNLQYDIQHSHQPPYYYEICFFEKPYVLYTYQSTQTYLLYSLVEAPFGKTTRIGIVWRQCIAPEATFFIKELIGQITEPLLTPLSLQFLEFCARYYAAPLQEVLTAAIPSSVRANTKRMLPILAQTDSTAQLSCLTLDQEAFVQHFLHSHISLVPKT